MKPKLILVGSGGHCRACIDVVEQEGCFDIVGIIDLQGRLHQKILGYPIIGTDEELPRITKKYDYFLIALGQIKSPDKRIALFKKIKSLGGNFPIIVSPLAYVSKHAIIEEGTIVMHKAMVNAGATIGKNCVINTKALIEHDAKIRDHCNIAINAVVNGGCTVGEGTLFDSTAMAREYVKIGACCATGGEVGCAIESTISQHNQSYLFSQQNKLKIGYFGDGEWAHGAFELFCSDPMIQIQFVVVRNDHPDPVLINLAEKNHIPWVTNENINSDAFLDWMSSHQSDLFISMSFNQIFKKRTFELPSFGTVNCHAGMLPFYRGRNILNWALINDEKEFGITVHYIDEGIDTGDIIDQKIFPITDSDNYSTLLDKAIKECPTILYGAVKKISSGNAKRIHQETIHPIGMYCSQRKAGDENLDWNQNTRDIFNFIRAICKPGPMARCMLEDDEICINKAAIVPMAHVFKGIPGAVLYTSKKSVFVKTKDTMIEILEYKKKGRNLRAGDRLRPKIDIK